MLGPTRLPCRLGVAKLLPASLTWLAMASGCNGVIGGGVGDPTGTPNGAQQEGLTCSSEDIYGGVARIRRLTISEYRNVIGDVFGVAPSDQYPGAYGKPLTGFSTEPGISSVSEQGVEQILYAAEDVAEALAPKVGEMLPCAANADEACAQTFLDTFGRRTFRRTLTSDERQKLLAVYGAERADGATFSEAVSVMTMELLQMPAFLYVIEAPAEAGENRELDGVELATRLSLLLWGSAPDEALLDKAESGQLTGREAVLSEAQRMVDDPRGDRGIIRFFREWTQTTLLMVSDKDPTEFDYLDDTLAASINESFDRFVVDAVRSGGTVADLLQTSQFPVDGTLAEFFGVGSVSSWTETSLPEDRYAGIMTHPAMLAALARAVDPSYVLRGKFVRKRLLCQELAPPPANAMTVFEALEKPADPTAKDISAVVRANPQCASCHDRLDPPGLTFERFDALGAYRDAYKSGKTIDTSGTLTDVEEEPMTFAGPVELMSLLGDRAEVRECLSRQVFRYMASRLEGSEDDCSIERVSNDLSASGGELRAAILAATQTDAFLYRKGD